MLVFPVSAQKRSSGTVRVRGYVRRDGTYVAPHLRSNPDGRFYNNWSSSGNVNPYTGKEGTQETPPSNYQFSSKIPLSYASKTFGTISPSIQSRRDSRAVPILDDVDMRLRKAKDLKRLGIEIDHEKHSWLELSDMEMRVRKARDLSRLGIEVDWQTHSWVEMSDWEMRFRKAQDLKRVGYEVDWQKHKWLEMSDWEMRIRKAQELERLGVKVNWRDHSWLDLSEMQRKARGK